MQCLGAWLGNIYTSMPKRIHQVLKLGGLDQVPWVGGVGVGGTAPHTVFSLSTPAAVWSLVCNKAKALKPNRCET